MRTAVENWREDARFGHTHEPNDVTVQLDGLGRQLSELPGGPNPEEGSDGPVFVDESGRRSKKFRRLGWVLAIACACYAITVVVALMGGNSKAPWLLIPGPAKEKATSEVEEQPGPTDPAVDPAVPGGTPGAPASTGSTVPQQPGTTGSPRTSGDPSASADPGTTTEPTDGAPGGDVTGGGTTGGGLPDPGPTVSTPPAGGTGGQEPPPPTPTPTDTETAPTEEPTEPPVGDGGQQAVEGAR
ncbi:hypothetical protein [Streptomyces sp. NPDC002133]|uniref:hypothetical protein n=1 Tax=Streptomyces sp. NPDC002133 TaxID=3154409 RepID=UPI003319016A